ncbi:unnamed protein product [Camellia sinensis]
MNNTVWLTNAYVHSNNSIAVLSEKGDPTLKDSVSGLTLLESFNYPCETFLALHDARTEHKNRRETLPIFLEDRRRPIAWKVCLWDYTRDITSSFHLEWHTGHCPDIPIDLTSYAIISREVCTSHWALITTLLSALWS